MILFKSALRKRIEAKRTGLVRELLKISDEKRQMTRDPKSGEYFKLVIKQGNINHDINLLDDFLNKK